MTKSRFDIQELLPALRAGKLILVPNQRTREALIHSLMLETDQQVWHWPKVEAIDIWLKELWIRHAAMGLEPFCNLQLLDTTEELFIWLKLVDNTLDETPLLNPEETAVSLSRSYQLNRQWLVGADSDKLLLPYAGIPDVAAFIRWEQKFQSFCQRDHLVSLADLTRLLLDHIELLKLEPNIVLVNFFNPPPLYKQLFKTLETRCETSHLECNLGITTRQAVRYEFTDVGAETKACVDWAVTVCSTEPDAEVAVICPGGEQQVRQVSRLFHQRLPELQQLDLNASITPVNVSATDDDALSGFALINNALRILNLGVDQQDSLEFCHLLRSPYLLAAESEREPRLQLQLYLRRNANPSCRLSQLSSQMSNADRPWHCPQLAALLLQLRTIIRACPRSQFTSSWIACFRNILQLAGWPGLAITAAEASALQCWHRLLDRLSGYDNTLGKQTLEQMLARLTTACSYTNVDRPHVPQCRVTLYRPDQAIGLGMTHVWMLGMDDQSWPPSLAPAPFLPHELQRRFNMPSSHAAVQQQDANAIIDLLCRAARTQLVSSHSLVVEEQKRRPAACFADIPPQQMHTDTESAVQPAAEINTLLEWVPDNIALPLLTTESLNGDSKLPGSQSSCPFQAFARYRLKARPIENFVSGLSPAARGAAVHKALEHFWSQLSNSQQLLALTADQLEQLLDSAVEAAVSDLQYRHPETLTPAFRNLEKQRLHALISRFLEEERQRNPFTVLNLEQNLTWQRGPLQLRLKSDRIDQLADGSLALLDYKSGKQTANPVRWLDDRPLDLQLPVYQYAVDKNYDELVSAVVIAHVNAEKTGFGGMWEKEGFLPTSCPVNKLPQEYQDNWEAVLRRWHESIDRLTDEFIDGRLCVSPAHRVNSCQHCGLQGLCRITELDNGIGDADADIDREMYSETGGEAGEP